ncbi:MAG: sugar phosphate isomerase/epimerase [Roseiflexaceae bacterium]|nr:sugar phosphate isomerase/epimerase [Roseiflexaceae bacterium]
MAHPISLQMYTLREETARDFVGTLEKVAELGYGAVELAGYGNLTPTQLRAEVDRLGLRVSGAHTSIDRLEGDLDQVISELQTLGARYAICPWLGPNRRPDAEGYKTLAASLNTIGAACAKAGLTFAYHHHDFELKRFGDTTGLHIILNESDPALVKAEIDVYWAAYAGFDPIALLHEFSGRVPLVHLKDMTPEPERTFAEVGQGTLDIPGIIAAADAAGAEWLIVEQDRCQRPALESIRMSREYLKSLGR